MLGSLDNPPIVIRGSRIKAGAMLLLALAILALMLGLPHPHAIGRLIGFYVFTGMVVVAVAVFAAQLFSPDSLEFSAQGISIRILFRRSHYEWAYVGQIYAINVWPAPSVIPTRLIVLDYNPPTGRRGRPAFPRLMELWPSELLTVAESAQARWGKVRQAHYRAASSS